MCIFFRLPTWQTAQNVKKCTREVPPSSPSCKSFGIHLFPTLSLCSTLIHFYFSSQMIRLLTRRRREEKNVDG